MDISTQSCKETLLLRMFILTSFTGIFSKALVVFGCLWLLWLFVWFSYFIWENHCFSKAAIRLMLLSIFLPINFFIWPLQHCAVHVSLCNVNVSLLILAFGAKSNQINVIHAVYCHLKHLTLLLFQLLLYSVSFKYKRTSKRGLTVSSKKQGRFGCAGEICKADISIVRIGWVVVFNDHIAMQQDAHTHAYCNKEHTQVFQCALAVLPQADWMFSCFGECPYRLGQGIWYPYWFRDPCLH